MDCHTHSVNGRRGQHFILKFFGKKKAFKSFLDLYESALLPMINELKKSKKKSKRLTFKEEGSELECSLDGDVLTIHIVSQDCGSKKEKFNSLLANVYKEIQFEDELREVMRNDLVSRGLPGNIVDHLDEAF